MYLCLALKSDKVIIGVKSNIKYARQNGAHATPTFAVNGLIENSVSSGWTEEQWDELLNTVRNL